MTGLGFLIIFLLIVAVFYTYFSYRKKTPREREMRRDPSSRPSEGRS